MDGGEAYREERAVFESEYLFFDFNKLGAKIGAMPGVG